MKEVDKEAIKKATYEVLGQVDPGMNPDDFEWPDVMCEIAEKAGYNPGEDLWTYPDDYSCEETEVLFAIDDIMHEVVKELGLVHLVCY